MVNQNFGERPRQVILSDITYLYHGRNRNLFYLCTFIDAYTREVLGWAMSKKMDVELVRSAYAKMKEAHGSELDKAGVLIHSDQGSQYTSTTFQQILRDAGIEVETGVCEAECREINEVFFHYITHKTPFVVLKYAMTLDGKIAAHTGDSRWVTGEAARRHVHETRNRLSGIMVGVGTVLADDPLLTCRIDGGRNPVRIVCDSHARTPLGSQLVQTANEIPTYVAVTARSERTAALEEKGVRILVCGETDGHVDLTDLMQQLGSAGINGILLEGGSSLAFSALKAGIVRRVQAYIAPKLIGGADAKSPVGGEGLAKMADALALKNVRSTPLGEDFLIEGRL